MSSRAMRRALAARLGESCLADAAIVIVVGFSLGSLIISECGERASFGPFSSLSLFPYLSLPHIPFPCARSPALYPCIYLSLLSEADNDEAESSSEETEETRAPTVNPFLAFVRLSFSSHAHSTPLPLSFPFRYFYSSSDSKH